MEENKQKRYEPKRSKGVLFGIILIVLGSVFLGINFGNIPENVGSLIISWPMFFILVGVFHLFKRHLTLGLMALAFGIFFIIPKLAEAFPEFFNNIHGDFTKIYWPLLLVFAGIIFIFTKLAGPKWSWKEKFESQFDKHHYNKNTYSYGKSGGFDKNSVFGNVEHIVLDPEFKGGEMNAVFGGITLDLRRTNLPEGETILDINAVFGGVSVFIPSDWFVETHIDTVFGGMDDRRIILDLYDTSKKLIITGSCVFGGFELRN